MKAALATEMAKFARSNAVRATTIIMVAGIALICSSMLLAVGSADPQLTAKLGALIDPGGWAGYLAVAAQVTAAASVLGFGVVLSWLFGREFADGTITGLFGLPVSRPTIAAAKLVVYLAWSAVTSVGLLVALVAFGMLFGLGGIPLDVAPALGRQLALSVLTAAIATPVAWAATLGRSLLAGVGAAIGILVASQVAVIAGVGDWFTFSAPGLWAVSAGSAVSGPQLMLVLPLLAFFAGLTLFAWRRMQLDR